MATNSMMSSLYQAPQGLEAIAAEPVLEIEIENPEGLKIGMDGVEIDLMPEKEEGEFDANLAEEMDEGEAGPGGLAPPAQGEGHGGGGRPHRGARTGSVRGDR